MNWVERVGPRVGALAMGGALLALDDLDDFVDRWSHISPLLDEWGVNHRPVPPGTHASAPILAEADDD